MSKSLLAGIPILLAIGWGACTPSYVIQPEPMVKFTQPEGAVLFVKTGDGVVRVRFNSRKRLAPVICEATNAQVKTDGWSESLRHTLELISTSEGFARVQLHDADGKLLAKGALCIFPTVKTQDRAIRDHYVIELPPKFIARLKAGKHASVFQTYRPRRVSKPGWNHLAWVIYLRP